MIFSMTNFIVALVFLGLFTEASSVAGAEEKVRFSVAAVTGSYMDEFVAMNEVYGTFFTEQPPARATVQAARLPRDARVEIEAIALAG